MQVSDFVQALSNSLQLEVTDAANQGDRQTAGTIQRFINALGRVAEQSDEPAPAPIETTDMGAAAATAASKKAN